MSTISPKDLEWLTRKRLIDLREKLTQAIFAKAFRREYVVTEAKLARCEGRSYEPASALLSCIRPERIDRDAASTRHSTKRKARAGR